jgi:hypothetical protein
MFKRTFQLLLISCMVAGALWAADDPFVGQWKLNGSKSKIVDVMKVGSLGGNKYTFSDNGSGPETIVADGTDQRGISGTTFSFTIEGPDTWKVVRKKDGRVLLIAIWNLSQDGNTLKDDFTSFGQDGSPSNFTSVYKRTAGGSGFADTWVSTTVTSVEMLHIQPYEAEGLSFLDDLDGLTINVKFDGRDYPIMGPNSVPGFVSSARRVNALNLELTDKFKGSHVDTRDIELSSDLKTLTMTVHSAGKDEADIYVFERQ